MSFATSQPVKDGLMMGTGLAALGIFCRFKKIFCKVISGIFSKGSIPTRIAKLSLELQPTGPQLVRFSPENQNTRYKQCQVKVKRQKQQTKPVLFSARTGPTTSRTTSALTKVRFKIRRDGFGRPELKPHQLLSDANFCRGFVNDLRDAKFRLGLVSLDSDQRHRELSADPATLTAITSIV